MPQGPGSDAPGGEEAWRMFRSQTPSRQSPNSSPATNTDLLLGYTQEPPVDFGILSEAPGPSRNVLNTPFTFTSTPVGMSIAGNLGPTTFAQSLGPQSGGSLFGGPAPGVGAPSGGSLFMGPISGNEVLYCLQLCPLDRHRHNRIQSASILPQQDYSGFSNKPLLLILSQVALHLLLTLRQ